MMVWITHLVYLALPLFVFADDDAVALGSDNVAERGSRILLQDQDNYYTLVSKVDHQETELATLKSDFVNMKAQLTNTCQQAEFDKLKAEVATLKSQQAMRHHVAFKAHLAKPLSPGQDQTIVFDDVRLNVGQAYHLGVFIAPYDGTYLFSVTMCSATNHFIYVDLLRNGIMIGQVFAGDADWAHCSSETTVTELSAGDDVTVQHHGTSGDYIYGTPEFHNSFTGVLLY